MVNSLVESSDTYSTRHRYAVSSARTHWLHKAAPPYFAVFWIGSWILYLFDPWIRDPGWVKIRIQTRDPDLGWTTRIIFPPGWKNSDPGWRKLGSGTRNKHSGSATLIFSLGILYSDSELNGNQLADFFSQVKICKFFADFPLNTNNSTRQKDWTVKKSLNFSRQVAIFATEVNKQRKSENPIINGVWRLFSYSASKLKAYLGIRILKCWRGSIKIMWTPCRLGP